MDIEGAYARITNWDGTLKEYTTRQLYFQAAYEVKAIEILKMTLRTGEVRIRSDLIEFEKEGWRRLGVPIDDPKFKDLADGIIREKYAPDLSR